MKKILILLVCVLVLAGCSTGSESEGKYRIGVIKWADHTSLDESVKGFVEEVGDSAVIIEKSAQGDMGTALMILKQFEDEKVDMIYAVATPAAQMALQETKMPLVFSAVTDPEDAQLLVEDRLVVGVSDEPALDEQMTLIKTLMPKAAKIGVLYNTSEANSLAQMQDVRKIASKHQLEIIEKGVSEQNEIGLATESLVSQVDAMLLINDNLVVASAAQVTQISNNNLVPVFLPDDGQFDQGGLATLSVSYLEMGKEAGKMALAIKEGKVPTEKVLFGKDMELKLFLNRELAKKFSIKIPGHLIIAND